MSPPFPIRLLARQTDALSGKRSDGRIGQAGKEGNTRDGILVTPPSREPSFPLTAGVSASWRTEGVIYPLFLHIRVIPTITPLLRPDSSGRILPSRGEFKESTLIRGVHPAAAGFCINLVDVPKVTKDSVGALR